MELRGAVSLWIGKGDSRDALDAYLRTTYTDDGDRIPSEFDKRFNLKRYEPGFREADSFENTGSLSGALAGCSYDLEIIPQFVRQFGDAIRPDDNLVVLVYDYLHDGILRVGKSSGIELRYLGHATYAP